VFAADFAGEAFFGSVGTVAERDCCEAAEGRGDQGAARRGGYGGAS
jgi:hypothetical protein